MAPGEVIEGEPLLDEDAALRKIVEGVEAATGSEFFRSLVRCVSETLGVAYAFVSELDRDRRCFRTLAVWGRGRVLDNFELPVAGTPCEGVLEGRMAHYADSIQQRFPKDTGLAVWQAESYCGVPLIDSSGTVLGHLAIFDVKRMDDPRGLSILRIFATRARAEAERLCIDQRLRANESRFRDLYEEAPVGYVTVGTDGLVRQVNRRTVEMYGYTSPDEIIGHPPADFCPDTPWRPMAFTSPSAVMTSETSMRCRRSTCRPWPLRVP